jgi:hypothetical protein
VHVHQIVCGLFVDPTERHPSPVAVASRADGRDGRPFGSIACEPLASSQLDNTGLLLKLA